MPETQKLRDLHYEEADTLNSEQIKNDFPVLQQKVNGHDLVWLDNGATTQKPNQVIDKISDPKNRVSVVSFVLDGIPVPEVGTLLDKEGIAVRAGHHCAQPALRALGYEMSVRPTFALYNTREDVDKLVVAVRKIVSSRRA